MSRGSSPVGAAFPGANGKIAFVRDDGPSNREVYSMNSDGSSPANLTNNAAFDDEPAWSADGTKIAFSSNRDGNSEIYTMNADGTGVTRLTNNSAIDARPTWSPDGTRIAFVSNRSINFEVFVMDADGTGQTDLTNDPGLDDQPAWSPNGAKIAFASDRDGDLDVYTMSPAGAMQTNITNNLAFSDQAPNWSPNSAQIVFQSNQDAGGDDEIYVMNADGSSPTRLTFDVIAEGSPAWSPDGTKIAFTKFTNATSNYDIYAMNANGTNQQQLTTAPATDTVADWQPVAAAVGGVTELASADREALQQRHAGSLGALLVVVFAALSGTAGGRLPIPHRGAMMRSLRWRSSSGEDTHSSHHGAVTAGARRLRAPSLQRSRVETDALAAWSTSRGRHH